MIELLNVDCMEYMAGQADKSFDLAIVDPPYGIDAVTNINTITGGIKHDPKEWDKTTPSIEYFDELFRVSRNQIMWGANYYISKIGIDTPCWLFWDKNNGESTFADGEMAWTSFKTPVRKIKVHWCGSAAKHETGSNKIHPTQKPRVLYDWLLRNYAEKGQRILDTHGGSFSSAIAGHYFGCDMVVCEIDKDYFAKSKDRFEKETRQVAMF